jgi:hypothetical protein
LIIMYPDHITCSSLGPRTLAITGISNVVPTVIPCFLLCHPRKGSKQVQHVKTDTNQNGGNPMLLAMPFWLVSCPFLWSNQRVSKMLHSSIW